MSVSLQFLERSAADTGFQPVAIEKVTRLGELAADIGRHPFLREVLALKGGTALNLAFGAPSRLSVDLDFNYIGEVDRRKMLVDRPKVENAVADLARRSGYKVQVSADAFAGRKMFLAYQSALGSRDRIEVDLNFLFRQPLRSVEVRTLWQPEGLDRPRVPVVSLEELLIGKFLALLDRTAARDAWDVANLFAEARELAQSASFRTHFIAMAAVLTHPLPEYNRSRLAARVSDRAVREQLAPMLITGEVPEADWLVRESWQVVQPLLALEEAEETFFDEVARGSLRLDLLFGPESAAAERLASHPALLWRMTNVRQHLEKRPNRTDS